MGHKFVRGTAYTCVALLILAPVGAAVVGHVLGFAFLHPANLNPNRSAQAGAMLARTGAQREDFSVRAPDGAELRGWKIHAATPNADWMLLFHGISDNRTGVLGPAEFLLRHGYSVVMMDSRAHGESGGDVATYGWKERYDTKAVTDALNAAEKVRHLGTLGVSMGAAIALQSAAIDPPIEAVVAEDPFANLREESYDYAGLERSPLLGKTLFRTGTIFAMNVMAKYGGFPPDEISPERAVAERPFPVLVICGTEDHRIPCRHAERIYQNARGPKELWVVPGAGHAAALGHSPAEYENRVISFLAEAFGAR